MLLFFSRIIAVLCPQIPNRLHATNVSQYLTLKSHFPVTVCDWPIARELTQLANTPMVDSNDPGLGMRRLNENDADYIIGPCILQLEVFRVCFIHVVLIHGKLTCRRLPCRAC
jgi:hypothetical protein